MSMPIKVRASFTQDANFVERLRAAVDADSERDPDWKRRTIEALNDVVILLRQADIAKLQKAKEENHAEAEEPTGTE